MTTPEREFRHHDGAFGRRSFLPGSAGYPEMPHYPRLSSLYFARDSFTLFA
jgi:hypothetical protein